MLSKKIQLINIEKMKAQQRKYYNANRDKINEQRCKRHNERYANDPEFRMKAINRTKENYHKKKAKLNPEKNL